MRLIPVLVIFLSFICYSACSYLRATTTGYNIGFENISNRSSSNQRKDIGFENIHNITANRKPTYRVTTTPPYRPGKPKNTPPPKPYVTTPPKKLYPTTKRPSKPKATMPPPTSKPKPISSTKKPTTTQKPKPKITTTPKPKPTRPTLPPSIYVKPNISKVIIPPLNSFQWSTTPPPPGWQPNLITTTPAWKNPIILQPTLQPTLQPIPERPSKEASFGLFLTNLREFTKKAEHNHQIKYKRFNGDVFNYYYEISNVYHNPHLAAKNYRVPTDLLKNCQTNTSKVMCLPNTNSICLTNGTMMCVTHLSATIRCEDNTASCAITYMPCDARYQSCLGNSEPVYVGVPCISRVVLVPSTKDFYEQLTLSPIEYCVTSVITPKRLYSPVGSFMSMLVHTAKHNYNLFKNSTLNLF